MASAHSSPSISKLLKRWHQVSPKLAAAFEKDPFCGAFVVGGSDAYKLDLFRDLVGVAWGKKDGVETVNGSQTTVSQVQEMLLSPGLFQPRFVLWVQQAQSLKGVERLVDEMEALTESDPVLVLHFDAWDQRRKVAQSVKKSSSVLFVDAQEPKSYELLPWAKLMAEAKKLKVTDEILQLLAVTSESLGQMYQEMEKLDLASRDWTDKDQELWLSELRSQQGLQLMELAKAFLSGMTVRSLMLLPKMLRSTEDVLGFMGFLNWVLQNPEKVHGHPITMTAEQRRSWLARLAAADLVLKGQHAPHLVSYEGIESPLVLGAAGSSHDALSSQSLMFEVMAVEQRQHVRQKDV